jgi:hypothetical protein
LAAAGQLGKEILEAFSLGLITGDDSWFSHPLWISFTVELAAGSAGNVFNLNQGVIGIRLLAH